MLHLRYFTKIFFGKLVAFICFTFFKHNNITFLLIMSFFTENCTETAKQQVSFVTMCYKTKKSAI